MADRHTIVDSLQGVSDLVDAILAAPSYPPSVYLDLEGLNLCRNGSISIIQIYLLPSQHTYLLDVYVLGSKAFTTYGTTAGAQTTIKSIFESARIPKVIFDVRNDHDALYNLHGVSLVNVEDIQLMELATRGLRRRYVKGLAKLIESDLSLGWSERDRWHRVKDAGKKKYAPEHGGDYRVFYDRPMDPEILEYCVQDVKYLPMLWKKYDERLSSPWRNKVREATLERLTMAKDPNYNPTGRDKTLGPWP